MSYSMPQGDKRGAGWEFFDATYDGHWDGQLQRGLGQLTDGKVGPENFKMGYYDSERGDYISLNLSVFCKEIKVRELQWYGIKFQNYV